MKSILIFLSKVDAPWSKNTSRDRNIIAFLPVFVNVVGFLMLIKLVYTNG